MDTLDLKNINLYEFFDLTQQCSETEIKKAYRKKALIHHPDKNPDDPKAKELFQKLSKALEILLDKKARESYDRILNARKERALKHKKLDAKRRKFQDDLEAKEKAQQEFSILEEEERLKREVDRIRKEGSKQLEEENLLLKKKLEQQRNESSSSNRKQQSSTQPIHNTIKVKLKRSKKLADTEITDELIQNEFSRFGPILSIVKSKKSALLEYEHYDSLKQIAADCPKEFEFEILNVINKSENRKQKPEQSCTKAMPTIIKNDDDDYEDYIMKRMQEAAEQNQKRKILTE